MKTKLIIALLGLFIHLNLNAQNYIYKGNKQYEATNTWSFSLNAHYWTTNPEITIAKNENGGYLMLSIVVPFSFDVIKGNLTIILEDGTMLKCIDKGIRDYVDETSTNLYFLTSQEIEKMKNSRISKIRFNINSRGEVMPYTASNYKEKRYIVFGNKDEKDYYETDVEISNLFED